MSATPRCTGQHRRVSGSEREITQKLIKRTPTKDVPADRGDEELLIAASNAQKDPFLAENEVFPGSSEGFRAAGSCGASEGFVSRTIRPNGL